jgi:iron complex outermembrane receptor protein
VGVTTLAVALLTTVAATAVRAQTAAPSQTAPGATATPIARSTPTVIAVPPVVAQPPVAAAPATQRRRRVARRAPAQPSSPAPVAAAAAAPPVAPPSGPAVTQELPGTLVVVDDAFVPVTVVPGREIEATQGATLTSTLQNRPGITGSTFAAGANRPIIRGLDNARVRTQENGIGTHDVAAISEDHAVPIDPNAVEQVEVIRGPATLRYGSNAIGGVVSGINGRIPEAVPPKGFSATVKGGVTSVDDGRDGAFAVTAGAGNIALHADAFTRRADDYDTPQGRQANTFVESDGFSVGGALVGSWGFAGVNFQRFESLYGIPGVEAVEEDKRIDLAQDKINARGEFRVRSYGIEAVRFWFGRTDYTHVEIAEGEAKSVFSNDEREGRIEVQHQPVRTPFGRMTGAIGIQAGDRTTSGLSLEPPDDADSLLLPAETTTIAGFIFEEIELTRALTLQLAARHERTEVSGVGPDPADRELDVARNRTFDPTSASVGVLYALPMGIVARATAQYTERAPDAQELFSNGPHEATETFELGDVTLREETATTFELGLKKAAGALRFDASVFHTRFDGFIFKQLTGVFCEETVASCGTVQDGLELLNFRQRDATFTGFELAAQYDIAPIWRGVWGVEGQFDVVRATFDDGSNVPRIPPVRIGGGVYYRDAAWLARINTLHAFEQDKIALEETATSGYTLLNAELSYTMKLAPDGLVTPEMTIGLKGENLLDDDVRNHVSFKKDEVLEPGARVRVFGTLKLN